MKTPNPHLAGIASILAFTGLATTSATALPVTFQVDMSVQEARGDFDPETDFVYVRGEFDTWGAGVELESSAEAPLLYTGEVEVDLAAGATLEYKFVRIDIDSVDHWEGNVGANNAQNRSVVIEEGDAQTVPVAFFNNITSGPGEGISVTFRVDMSIQQSIGAFDPNDGFVELRGEFNSWAGSEMEPGENDPLIYEWTEMFAQAEGTDIAFKFAMINGDGELLWEGDVGPNGAQNRVYTVGSADTVLEPLFFNNLDVDPGAGAEVTFQVDMTARIENETFLPEFDTVELRGPFPSWDFGTLMDPVEEGSAIYATKITINSISPGGEVPYKYQMNGSEWESGDNRTFVLQEGGQTLPARYFNDEAPGSSLSDDTEVVITVDMNNAVTHPDGVAFDPEADTLFVNGEFVAGGWWQGGAPAEYEMFDNGDDAFGDAVAGDGIYSFLYFAPAGTPKRMEYKFFINGQDNEAGFQENHVRYIRATGDYSLPTDTFGVIVVEDPDVAPPVELGELLIRANSDAGTVTLSWNNQSAVLEVARDLSAGDWEPVTDAAGEQDYEWSTTEDTEAYFRLGAPEQ